jgi:hypothetical protein
VLQTHNQLALGLTYQKYYYLYYKYYYFYYNSKYSYKKYYNFCLKYYYFYYNSKYSYKKKIICAINIIIFIIILLGVSDAEPIGLESGVRTQLCWGRRQDPMLLGLASWPISFGSSPKPKSRGSCIRNQLARVLRQDPFRLGPRLDPTLFWVHLGQDPT